MLGVLNVSEGSIFLGNSLFIFAHIELYSLKSSNNYIEITIIYIEFNIYTRKAKSHLRLACRMNVKNETARILRAHAERAGQRKCVGKNLFQTI